MNEQTNSWELNRKKQRETADWFIDQDNRSDDVISVCSTWIRELIAYGGVIKGRNVLIQQTADQRSLPDLLREKGLPDWGSSMDRLAVSEQHFHTGELLAAERIIGRALGKTIGGDPCGQLFALKSSMAGIFHDCEDSFQRGAEIELLTHATAIKQLTDLVRQRIWDFTASPRKAVYVMDRRNTCDLVETYRQSKVRDVWCTAAWSTQMIVADECAYYLLMKVDPFAWVELVDCFPTSEPVAQVVQSCRPEKNSKKIFEMIEHTAPAFDQAGEWRHQHKIIFHLLHATERMLVDAAQITDQQSSETQFDTTLKRIQCAIKARLDASYLGHAWLEQLAWKDYAGGDWRAISGDVSSIPHALTRTFRAIAKVISPRADVWDWIAGEDVTWQPDRLLVALCVLTAHANPDECGDFMIQAATRGLAGGAERMLATEGTLASNIIGALISEMSNPALWVRSLWEKTFLLRDRSRHQSVRTLKEYRDVNLICITWGLSGLRSIESSSHKYIPLWEAVAEMAREAYITLGRWDVSENIPKAVRMLAALWNEPSRRSVSDLAAFLVPYRFPNRDFLSIVLTLEKSGAPLADIIAASGGKSVLRYLAACVLDEILRTTQPIESRRATTALDALIKRIDGSN